MRNLVPYVSSWLDTADESPLPLQKFIFVEDSIVCAFADDECAAIALWSPALGWHTRTEWPLPAPDAQVVGIHCDSIDDKIMVVVSTGDFVEIAHGEAVEVGSVGNAIQACEWSPTGEVACLVTDQLEVILINTDFDLGDVVVNQHRLSPADLALAEQHVSVGWGKRETQFQGRGARAARSADPTINQDIETRDPFSTNAGTVSVSWRGDGEYVVVNATVEHQRALYVFTKEGKLSSVSEPASQLHGLVAYEPRGALIATVRENELLFFERNGLKRYSFAIPDGDRVCQLSWSSDSSILAVAYATGAIDLWTQKNWHWYRKQRVHKRNAPSIVWHPERPRTMGVRDGLRGIQFGSYEFSVANDQGLVAVIDHNEIKVTPLSYAGVPPPMAFATHKFAAQPVAVAVQAPATIAVALDTEVQILKLDADTATLKLAKTVPLIAHKLAYGSELVIELSTGSIVDEQSKVVANPGSAVSVLQGSHYMLGSQLFTFNGQLLADFGEPCTDFVTTPTNSFGLTRSGKLLHANGTVVAHGVTSMLSTDTHMLFTTLTTLRFVHLHASPSNNTEFVFSGEQTREIERGSILVSIMTERMAVVLQAPRGNLETIYPRMLVLGVIREYVAQKNYKAAFTACKIHRIDMNLLYDLNPKQFDENTANIVEELGGLANIDLFLSSLSDENVALSKYLDTSDLNTAARTDDKSATTSTTIPGKANRVLSLLKPVLPTQCAVTALAVMKPPALVEALQLAASSPDLIKHLVFLTEVDDLYHTALGEYEPRLALAVAQQAQMDPKEYLPFLRSLMSHSSPHRAKYVVDVFLKRYVLAFDHLIAESQAEIDAGCQATSEIEHEIADFAIHHELLDHALQTLLGSGRESERMILATRAQVYQSQSNYAKAGLDLEVLGLTNEAITAYVNGGLWRRALSLTSDDKQREIAERLVEVNDANKKFGDCAHILLHYLERPKEAIQYYCQANQFDDATLVAYTTNLHSDLEDMLRESFGSFQELIADCRAQVPAQLKRLRQVRIKRQQDSLGFEKMAAQMEDLDVADTLSLTGTDASTATGASAYTRYTDKSGAQTVGTNATRRTLKNQRRQERKKARGKKGSVYEEDYLVASTSRLIERLQTTRPDILELITALVRVRQNIYARQLSAEFNAVLAVLRENIEEIYTVDEDALIRFDDRGFEYMAEKPLAPQLPEDI